MACKETKKIANPNLGKSNQERIKEAIDAGATMIADAKVAGVSISGYEDGYTADDGKDIGVTLTFNTDVAQNYIAQPDLTYKIEPVNYVNVKLFDIAGYITNSQDEDTDFVGKHIVRNPLSLERLLKNATVSFLQQDIKAGTEVVNLFSNKKEVTAKTYDSDFIKSSICKIQFSDKAKKRIEKIEDKILGI